MAGSTFGELFKVTTWGESHGEALGVVIDGCPAGIELSAEDIQSELDLRKPGSNPYGTKRTEDDKALILSGIFEGKTTGTPISIVVYNNNQNSKDYSNIKNIYRPGHADYGYDKKYGFRDYRGGGRSSGRETLSRVAAGAVAKKILLKLGISIFAYTSAIENISINMDNFDLDERFRNPLVMPDKEAYKKASELLDKLIVEGDSVGGKVDCVVKGMPVSIGEPVFDKLDAVLSKAIMSIGAVKGIEFGNGFEASEKIGSSNNDAFIAKDGLVSKLTNNAGGILGGISDSDDIFFRVAFKPTPSISKRQKTINSDLENTEIEIHGRHDPIIVPRAIVVVEAMCAIAITDMIFRSTTSKIEYVEDFIYNLRGL